MLSAFRHSVLRSFLVTLAGFTIGLPDIWTLLEGHPDGFYVIVSIRTGIEVVCTTQVLVTSYKYK